LAKHGVSFEAARLAFDDDLALDVLDVGGEASEVRLVTIGMVKGVILTVVHTERGERTRIISAKKSNQT